MTKRQQQKSPRLKLPALRLRSNCDLPESSDDLRTRRLIRMEKHVGRRDLRISGYWPRTQVIQAARLRSVHDCKLDRRIIRKNCVACFHSLSFTCCRRRRIERGLKVVGIGTTGIELCLAIWVARPTKEGQILLNQSLTNRKRRRSKNIY